MSFFRRSRRRIFRRYSFLSRALRRLSLSLFATDVFPATPSARVSVTSLVRIFSRGSWGFLSASLFRPASFRRSWRAVRRSSLKAHTSPPTPSSAFSSRAFLASSLKVGLSAGAHVERQIRLQRFTGYPQWPTSPATLCLVWWFGFGLLGSGKYDVAL